MSFKKWLVCTFMMICMAVAGSVPAMSAKLSDPGVDPQTSFPIEFITVEELKAQIAKNEPLTIIDVRSTGGLGNDERQIKGAIHVKLRRLSTGSAFRR